MSVIYDHRGEALQLPDEGPVSVRRMYDPRLHWPFALDTARTGGIVQAMCLCNGARAHEVVAAEPDCPDCLAVRA